MNKKSLLNLLVLVATFLCFVAPSFADATYRSHAVYKSDFQHMDWNGAKVTVGSIKGVSKVEGSTSAKMPNGEYLQSCLMRVIKGSEGTEVVTNCSTVDKDGDTVYSLSERKQGDVNKGGKGRTTFLGGTGKFQGIAGNCEYSAKYMAENWVSVDSDCNVK